MDKLSKEQQGQVTKMSDERTQKKLVAAGYDPEKVQAMSREQLLNAMAQLMAATALDSEVAPPAVSVGALGGSVVPDPLGGMSMDQFQLWLKWEERKAQRETVLNILHNSSAATSNTFML
jgi:hypothetical protein